MAIEAWDTIDTVIYNSETNVVSLVLMHAGEWDDESLMLELLKVKISNYLHFVSSGQFAESYPQYVNNEIGLLLECTRSIPSAISSYLKDLKIILKKDYNIKININIHDDIT